MQAVGTVYAKALGSKEVDMFTKLKKRLIEPDIRTRNVGRMVVDEGGEVHRGEIMQSLIGQV